MPYRRLNLLNVYNGRLTTLAETTSANTDALKRRANAIIPRKGERIYIASVPTGAVIWRREIP
ncbi:MAG: hypothetical protein OXC25_06015 [Thiotrichales bacterium]|nr:hypothetical protein [Thiotrichales bacterium]